MQTLARQESTGATTRRVDVLARAITCLPGRVAVLMDRRAEESISQGILVPAGIGGRYEVSGIGCIEWPRGTVVASGIHGFRVGAKVIVSHTDGAWIDYGHDPEAPGFSAILEPGEQLRFYRPVWEQARDRWVPVNEFVIEYV